MSGELDLDALRHYAEIGSAVSGREVIALLDRLERAERATYYRLTIKALENAVRNAQRREDEWKQRAADAEAKVRRIEELHKPMTIQVLTGDCSVEECGHEDECPTVTFEICAACHALADAVDTYYAERGVGAVAYPCPTIQALKGEPDD